MTLARALARSSPSSLHLRRCVHGFRTGGADSERALAGRAHAHRRRQRADAAGAAAPRAHRLARMLLALQQDGPAPRAAHVSLRRRRRQLSATSAPSRATAEPSRHRRTWSSSGRTSRWSIRTKGPTSSARRRTTSTFNGGGIATAPGRRIRRCASSIRRSNSTGYYRAELAIDSLGRYWVQRFFLEADGSCDGGNSGVDERRRELDAASRR